MKSLFMETTRISAEKTAAQIASLLGQAGAARVISEYGTVGGRRVVTAVYFELSMAGACIPYRLPIRVVPIRKLLARKRPRMPGNDLDAWAERVAWRQVLRWLEAQLALVETQMVDLGEVFLPYVQVSPTQTLYERMLAHQEFTALALPAPKTQESF